MTRRTPRGVARYLRRQLAAARRSGDLRRIATAEAEAAAARTAIIRAHDQARSEPPFQSLPRWS